MPRRQVLVAALLAVACSAPSAPAPEATPAAPPAATPAPAPQARRLAEDAAITTAWGATLAVPAGWFVTEAPDVVRVWDPDRELELAFVVVKAADHAAAIAAAWAIVAPGVDREPRESIDAPPFGGWDAVGRIVYGTPGAPGRTLSAYARRTGDTWHVTTTDGAVAALVRRSAQVEALILDMKVPGVEAESFAGRPARLDAERLARWSALVDEARALAGVPGVAVAVVHGGEVVLEQGFGVRVAGEPAPVTPDTRFMIGSITKPLTTLLLARLIDQGTLAWDTPVVDVLPSFALADAAVTEQVQVQHTVCACTGMPPRDFEFLFEYDGWDAERWLASMAAMTPTTGFGETFQYSNLTVATGGWLAGRAHAPTRKQSLNAAYEAAMSALVLRPLGLTATTFDVAKVTRADHARPHAAGFDLRYEEIALDHERALRSVGPAGAAWSTVRDLARYLLLELAVGKTPDGKQLVSADHLVRRRRPQVPIDEDTAYGLGLVVGAQAGVPIVGHGGNTLGFTSDLFWLPEHDVGVVVLANAGDANAFRAAVRRAFLEIVFDGDPRAIPNLTWGLADLRRRRTAVSDGFRAIDDAWAASLLGTYAHPTLGRFEIRRRGDELVLDVGEWTSVVTKFVNVAGEVRLALTSPPYAGYLLHVRRDGDRTVLLMGDGQHDYELVPVASP